jgi:hypothetical protein
MGAKPVKEVPTHFVSRAKKHLLQDDDDEEVPQREMVESWTMDEVADEIDERQLPHVSEKIAEQNVRGIDLFSFERDDLVGIGLVEEDIEKFLTMQTISMGHQESIDTAERLYANTQLSKVGAKATMEQGSNMATALTLGHGLKVGELVRIESSVEGGEEFFEVLRVDGSGQSVMLSSNFKGHDGDMGIHRAIQFLQLGYKKYHNAAFFRISKALAKSKTVTGVDVRFNKLNDVAAEKMLEVLASNQKIISCEMLGNKDDENTPISDERYGQIAVQCSLNIMEHKHLTSVDVREQRVDDAALKPLAEALLTNKTIVSLNLSMNKITDVGALQIRPVIEGNSTLQYIHLGYNNMTNRGAKEVATAALKNNTLTTLRICGNMVTATADGHYRRLAQTNKTLTDIGVGNTKISKEAKLYILLKTSINKIMLNDSDFIKINYLNDDSAMVVIEAMKNNDAAATVDLQHGEMTNISGAKLLELLAFNSSITQLNLHNNLEMDEEMHALIQSKVMRNRSAHDMIKQRHEAAGGGNVDNEDPDGKENAKGEKEKKK